MNKCVNCKKESKKYLLCESCEKKQSKKIKDLQEQEKDI